MVRASNLQVTSRHCQRGRSGCRNKVFRCVESTEAAPFPSSNSRGNRFMIAHFTAPSTDAICSFFTARTAPDTKILLRSDLIGESNDWCIIGRRRWPGESPLGPAPHSFVFSQQPPQSWMGG